MLCAVLLEPDMRSIPAGRITLRDEAKRRDHPVKLAAFEMAAHPVSEAQWAAVTGEGPSSELPKVEVSWSEAVAFCNALSQAAGLRPVYRLDPDPEARATAVDARADGYRLPREAEWEYACRAGSNEVRHGELDAIAWHRGNAGERRQPVGQLAPNAWGLFDTIGNVWEWCWDIYDPEVYGAYRVFRGGGFADLPHSLRASCRRKSHPSFRIDDLGFRVARSLG